MYIESLNIVNYKNIRQAELNFSPKINCFIGNNGMGKTNLLDAVYFLSFCKSHSNFIDSQNIFHEAEFAVLQAKYRIGEAVEEIYCGMKRNQKKQFKRNKKEYERLSDHIGLLPLVLISPEDSVLISEGSDERRKFVDGVISQYDKKYLHDLLLYNNALKQRNALLKLETSADESLFEILEEQMADYGSYIFEQRTRFIDQLIPVFQQFYHFISSNENEKIDMSYQSHHQQDDIKVQLRATRERDKMLGFSTRGIHKDELEMMLNGYPIKRVGSQGQNKTFLIALKLAQFKFLKQTHHQPPILLLDDIFDKLDADRVRKIVELVSQETFGQIFITDTNREHLDQILLQLNQEAEIFKVENGIIF
ncbi:MAG TPA: DNA replication/repair protein RecF [Paludibacteraceae bacterium]|jgi:DNA replication and repair protein RecF|nr:DNA replication/repair protein RecF [Porphyromonadaceae sp. NP-X]NLJ21278.1 DNA replication/repair protein RecF [Bacteroidales bacterium]HNZ61774.1 DNA replication/repair protein RecF [Paludibacteraceae bacterium]HOH54796.1 DNA replication/repair protein RecF [Paludibacteraceae bacterium]